MGTDLVASNDLHFMGRALELAQQAADLGEVPVGAVVVQDNAIIGEGFNRPISAHDPSAHAEIVALRDAAARIENYRLTDATLYVTLEPCTMCAGALVHARVSRLVFACREPRAGVICSQGADLNRTFYNHQVSWEEGPLADECAALLRAFFRARR